MLTVDRHPTPRQLRTFGLLLSVFVPVFGALIWWRTGRVETGTTIWVAGGAVTAIYWLAPPIRRPLYVGWMTAFWCTPTLTVGHALFAGAMTAYIVIAIRYEERDLAAALGEPYRRWRAATPMFVPRVRGRGRPAAPAAEPS